MSGITQENKLVYSVEEMASVLGISKPVAYELIKREGFPSVRLSERRIVIPVDSLREWLRANTGA